MSKNNEVRNELRVRALSQVKYAEKSLALLETLNGAYDHIPSEVKDAFLKIKYFFVEKEKNAYHNLLLLVSTMGDAEDREATLMALKRYVSNDMAVMHFWTHNGEHPGSWLDEDEQLLRDVFKELERELSGKKTYKKKCIKPYQEEVKDTLKEAVSQFKKKDKEQVIKEGMKKILEEQAKNTIIPKSKKISNKTNSKEV